MKHIKSDFFVVASPKTSSNYLGYKLGLGPV